MAMKRKKRKKAVPRTEVEILRESLRRASVYAIKPYKMQRWVLIRFVGAWAGKPFPVGAELAWERVNVNMIVSKFPTEELALRNAMLRPQDFIWRR
jgi:hypothetical protein